MTNTFCIPSSGLRATQGKVSTGRWPLPGSGLGGRVWEASKRSRRRRGGEAAARPGTYSRSSKLDFLSSALWGMSLKNRLQREKPRGTGPSELGHPAPTCWPRSTLPCRMWEPLGGRKGGEAKHSVFRKLRILENPQTSFLGKTPAILRDVHLWLMQLVGRRAGRGFYQWSLKINDPRQPTLDL